MYEFPSLARERLGPGVVTRFLELLLLLRLRIRDILGKESVRAIIITDVPKVLRHGDNETSDNQDSEQSGVLACINGEPLRKWKSCQGEEEISKR